MIYTITCNPALDCTVRLGDLQQGTINYVDGCVMTPGGKGVNVSRVLTALGEPNTALGFVAGSNGGMLEGALQRMGLDTAFIHLDGGQTRINVKLYGAVETELNAPGAAVPEEALVRLTWQLDSLRLNLTDTVCLCGSMAPGMTAEDYRALVHSATRFCRVVVDTSGAALLGTLAEKPWLIKPNREELEALTGRALPTLEAVVDAAKELMAKGARNVLVSLGGDGAVLCTEDGRRLYQPTPAGDVVGTVGAGDSLVAGFVAGYTRTGDMAESLRLGVACGSATAFAEGLATKPEIEAVLDRLPEMKTI